MRVRERVLVCFEDLVCFFECFDDFVPFPQQHFAAYSGPMTTSLSEWCSDARQSEATHGLIRRVVRGGGDQRFG